MSIINCGGKTELWKYAEILKEIDIKFITSADFDFLREGLNEYFTNLKYDKDFNDKLNGLKSKISSKVKNKYKSIGELNDVGLIKEVEGYLESLYKNGIFIFNGELENLYIEKPSFDKEAGVIETLGKIIEQSKTIDNFLELQQYNNLLALFVFYTWGLKEYKEKVATKAF
ncbi:MAG: hypothetical protein K2X86_11690 [Cytophagaceae bacterium]|nr:hypothetical protein [Cytophagaceae bacterium]